MQSSGNYRGKHPFLNLALTSFCFNHSHLINYDANSFDVVYTERNIFYLSHDVPARWHEGKDLAETLGSDEI